MEKVMPAGVNNVSYLAEMEPVVVLLSGNMFASIFIAIVAIYDSSTADLMKIQVFFDIISPLSLFLPRIFRHKTILAQAGQPDYRPPTAPRFRTWV